MKCEPVVLIVPSTVAERIDRLRAERWDKVLMADREAVESMCLNNGWPLDSFVAGTVVASLMDEVLP